MAIGTLAVSPGTVAAPAALAQDGEAQFPVVVGPEAPEAVRDTAAALAAMLGRIAGTAFNVESGSGERGIAVGTPADFPDLAMSRAWGAVAPETRERYRIRTHADGVWIIGATPQAVSHAVSDFLYRLGYRQYFPGPVWEHVPATPDVSADCDVDTTPAYLSRRIWYGYGLWDYNEAPYEDWRRRNRMGASIALSTGHAYGRIIRARQDAFDAHPEYYALVDGERTVKPQAKLCISNPELRALVIDYAQGVFAKEPDRDSISMDPSDGGGWCECEPCQTMGSVSDRALTLANAVAEAIQEPGKTRYVGIYAYNYHSPPPAIEAHPNVVVSVATAFLKGGYTLEEIVSGWARQGATLGIREYYSVFPWDHDMPGEARGANPAYLQDTIARFYADGARYLTAESSDNWGSNGLGYYLASRYLWDLDEIDRTEALIDEFLETAFGSAAPAMRKFYAQLDAGRPHLLRTDQLARMYRALAAAREATGGPAIRQRLDHLALYTRYVELFYAYQQARGEPRQAAFEEVIRHAYRMRETMMVHVKGLYRDQVGRDKQVSIPEDARWNVPEAENPWKESKPFTEEELGEFITAGIGRFPVAEVPFEPRSFSDNLVPAGLTAPDARPGKLGYGRGTQTFYTWAAEKDTTLLFEVTAGLIYGDRGEVRIAVWKQGGESDTGARETLVHEDHSVPPDEQSHHITLPLPAPGLYRIIVNDGGDLTRLEWPERVPVTAESSLENPLRAHSRWTAWFYVPEDTTTLGFFGGGTGAIVGPDGEVRKKLEDLPAGYYAIDIPSEDRGKPWKIQNASGAVRLMTVPPYLANHPEALLLPADVVAGDEIGTE